MHARVSPIIPFGAAKQNCYLCNGAPRTRGDKTERMIDTGVHIEFEGHIALCETCVSYMGKLLGLLTPDDVEALTDELREALETGVVQAARIAELEKLVSAQEVAFAHVIADLDENPTPVPA